MPNLSMVKITTSYRKTGNGSYVQIMALTIARTVVAEFAIVDLKSAVGIPTGQNSIFVANETTITNSEFSLLETYPSAIPIAYLGPCKIEAIDRHRATTDDPNRLSLRRSPLGQQPNPPPDSTQSQVVLLPDGDIAGIVSGIHFDRVTGPGDRSCYGDTPYLWRSPT